MKGPVGGDVVLLLPSSPKLDPKQETACMKTCNSKRLPIFMCPSKLVLFLIRIITCVCFVKTSCSDRCKFSTLKSEHISDEGMIVFGAAIKNQDSFHSNTPIKILIPLPMGNTPGSLLYANFLQCKSS